MPSSRLPGFYQMSLVQRQAAVLDWASLSSDESQVLSGVWGLAAESADHMVENVVGIFGLPVGIATNFLVNGRDVLVPMVIEEPSVVAGASFAAKLAREGGGFACSSSEPLMISQIQILDLADPQAARLDVLANRARLLAIAQDVDPMLTKAGGGPRDIEARVIESAVGPMLIVHVIVDCRDAMGANAVNTIAERLRPALEEITGGRVGLRILSNLADRRVARAKATIPVVALSFESDGQHFEGALVRDRIVEAWAFAAADPYRAATHNKGIMNGVDAVVLATGNDWRAIEAGAHTYAARTGRYTSLSHWGVDKDGNLVGSLEMPMAVGIVGGATKVHPAAKVALKLLSVTTARELAEIIVAVGLAQNLAASRALATEGIQRGHMTLHARQVAIAAGANGEQVERVAAQLVAERRVHLDRAQEIVAEYSSAQPRDV
jgi:hydroxymethylglutaryl-CoA reductase